MSAEAFDASELPVAIDDSETIVRAVVAPSHYKKGKIQTAVFRPPPGQSAISVIRQLMGNDFCKAKGRELVANSASQEFVGLLTIKAAAIRSAGSTVTDSRDVWLGHADLAHGFESVRDEPATREVFEQMTLRCQELKKASIFHEDPAPTTDGWTGATLKID